MEKRRLNNWFMWNTNHHLHRPQASFCSPEGEEALRPPRSDLRSPGKISRLGEYPCSRWEFSQKNGEQKWNNTGESVFLETDPFSLFLGLFIYFLLYIGMNSESCGVSRPDPCQNQVLHIKLYKGLRGFTSSSGHEACWHFMALSDNGQLTRKLIFSRGDFFLHQAPPSK